MSSYEQNCIDYALHGNPMRDAFEYEENARFDYANELKEEFFDDADVWYEEQRWNALSPEEQATETAANEKALKEIEAKYAVPEGDDCPF